nr:putative ribonuclease H-like domain-containing protein [Tanacetum cinerariifolium]
SGGSECLETLNLLRYVACGDGRGHSTTDESHLSTQPEDHDNVIQTAPNLIPEEQEMVFNQNDTPLELNEHVKEQKKSSTQEETLERYVLPPRENREVPLKRYSPEKVSRGSRYPMANIAKGNLSKDAKAFVASIYSDEILANTKQALNLRKWKKTMEEEMEALIKNNTREKCVFKPGKKIVRYWWVFTNKYKPDGTIERYKARLVAKGYILTYGIDYCETFSPVAKINTIRVLCSVAANKGWPLDQFDVKNAFLHRELKEEVVCLLKKSIYGLKQSPRTWFGKFTLPMKNHGFKQSNSDRTLFVKQGGNLITCPIIYVDDMIVTGDEKEEITKLKKYLFTEFKMKDLGRLKYFLGIEVLRSKQGIFMCQKVKEDNEELHDDELRRRVKEFIDKIYNGWKAEKLSLVNGSLSNPARPFSFRELAVATKNFWCDYERFILLAKLLDFNIDFILLHFVVFNVVRRMKCVIRISSHQWNNARICSPIKSVVDKDYGISLDQRTHLRAELNVRLEVLRLYGCLDSYAYAFTCVLIADMCSAALESSVFHFVSFEILQDYDASRWYKAPELDCCDTELETRLAAKGMLALQGLQESRFITYLMLGLQECS